MAARPIGASISAAILALAGPGCTQGVGPDSGPLELRTDRATYLSTYLQGDGTYRQYGFRLVAQLENRSGTTVYLARWYPDSRTPIYGVILAGEGGSPGSAYSGFWACVGHDHQIPVPAGATRVDTLVLRGPNAWDHATGQPFGTLSGRMKLRYEVQTCPGDGTCPLNDAVTSNVFRVALVR